MEKTFKLYGVTLKLHPKAVTVYNIFTEGGYYNCQWIENCCNRSKNFSGSD